MPLPNVHRYTPFFPSDSNGARWSKRYLAVVPPWQLPRPYLPHAIGPQTRAGDRSGHVHEIQVVGPSVESPPRRMECRPASPGYLRRVARALATVSVARVGVLVGKHLKHASPIFGRALPASNYWPSPHSALQRPPKLPSQRPHPLRNPPRIPDAI